MSTDAKAVSGAENREVESASVCIVGSGFAGIGAAIQARAQGFRRIVVLERAASVGGTWRDNTYPGCACDIPSHLYSFSFHLSPDWKRHFATQPEIRQYLEDVVDAHGVRPLLRFRAEVLTAHFDESRAIWRVTCADGRCFEAPVLLAGLGPLRIPKFPEGVGRERFLGPSMHSAQWDASVDLSGKRVAVVGTGASAIQVVPAIAGTAAHVHVVQRTPAWVTPRMDFAYPQALRSLFRSVPPLLTGLRGLIYAYQELLYPMVFAGPSWLRARIAKRMRQHIVREMGGEAEAAALIPQYSPGCKRILNSSAWYPALRRSDVSVHGAGLAEVQEDGILLDNGTRLPIDVLVYCTGFVVDDPLGSLHVVGRGGVSLREYWGGRPRAHLGVTVPGFPNLFLLLGPNSGLGHNSVVIMIEAQIRYICEALRYLSGLGPRAWLEARPEALDAFVDEIDRAHIDQVWNTGCSSWYLNAEGQNFSIWPGSTLSYMARTYWFDRAHYTVGQGTAP